MSFMEKEKRIRLKSKDFSVEAESAKLHALHHLYSGVTAQFSGFQGWERGRIKARPVVIYDLSGLPLFYDFPINRGRYNVGFIRTAANKALGDPVISSQVTPPGWNMRTAREKLQKLIQKKYPRSKPRRIRLVCYSYPKLALSVDLIFQRKDAKTLLMDVSDFTEIPTEPLEKIEKSGKVAYSMLSKITEEKEKKGPKTWNKMNNGVVELFRKEKRLDPKKLYKLKPEKRFATIKRVIDDYAIMTMYTEKTLDFCCHSGDCKDHECFCLHPQENGVHCTRASSQMVLCFWRYCYSQHEIAQAFGVEDDELTPWASVAGGLESLTNNCFNANLDYSVSWADCVNEIDNRRPFLSDDGGHTRVCPGYKKWNMWIVGTTQPRYLQIYDPWPVGTGAIYWENFNTANYAWNGTLARRTTNHT